MDEVNTKMRRRDSQMTRVERETNEQKKQTTQLDEQTMDVR